MKILFLTVEQDDYLSDSILHGLRQISGVAVIDYPKKESMYKSYPYANNTIYGNGFTLYKTLDDIEIDRKNIKNKIRMKYFDYIIFSDISLQFGYILSYYDSIRESSLIILDGDDSPKLFPFTGHYWRKYPYFLLPSFINSSVVLKREWTPLTLKYRTYFILPTFLCSKLYTKLKINQISFSIPEEKIVTIMPLKQKLFGTHIVDPEIACKYNIGQTEYAFNDETSYYLDLQNSKYGITTKRAGWDCMRHYEIAANAAVPCFRDLRLKPAYCAPQGLIPGINCLSYDSYTDLIQKIDAIDNNTYISLQSNAIKWVKTKTTKVMADYILSIINQ